MKFNSEQELLQHYFGSSELTFEVNELAIGTESYWIIPDSNIIITDGVHSLMDKKNEQVMIRLFKFISLKLMLEKEVLEFGTLLIVPTDDIVHIVIDDGNYSSQLSYDRLNMDQLNRNYRFFIQWDGGRWVVMLPSEY